MIKYILTLEADKYLKVQLKNGDTRYLPLGSYKVQRSGDIIRIYELGSRNEELSSDYRDLLSDADTQMFNSADDAEIWFASNFFVDAPGTVGGGGGVQSDDITNIVELSQAEYNALSPKDFETFYLITS